MKHINEDELVLYYYGEGEGRAEVKRHLDACPQCAQEMKKLEKIMVTVEPTEVPERGDDYGLQVWRQVRARLPERVEPAWMSWFRPQRLAVAGGLLALMIVAFIAGRWSQTPTPQVGPEVAKKQEQAGRERLLMVAVGKHLERSQMVLVELVNAESTGKLDISSEQEQARELLNANRLYRQTSQRAGEPAVNQLLGDLERVLVEIANGPSEVNAKELDQIRKQIESQGILLKVRIVGEKVREREKPAAKNPGQRET